MYEVTNITDMVVIINEAHGYRIIINKLVFRKRNTSCYLTHILGVPDPEHIHFFKTLENKFDGYWKKYRTPNSEDLFFPSKECALNAYEEVILPYVMAYKLAK